jgi:hypothetical protein
MFVAGCVLASLWRWVRGVLPASVILSRAYDGSRRIEHRLICLIAPIAIWTLICYGLFRTLILIDSR